MYDQMGRPLSIRMLRDYFGPQHFVASSFACSYHADLEKTFHCALTDVRTFVTSELTFFSTPTYSLQYTYCIVYTICDGITKAEHYTHIHHSGVQQAAEDLGLKPHVKATTQRWRAHVPQPTISADDSFNIDMSFMQRDGWGTDQWKVDDVT